MSHMHVQFQLLCEHAKAPTRATDGSAGYDIYACDDVVIPSAHSARIRTGLAMAPLTERPGFVAEAQIRGRSGLALNHRILALHFATIDSDYRDEIAVELWNFSSKDFLIKRGDRVAQVVFAWAVLPTTQVVDALPPSASRFGGLGSTGR